MQNLDSITLREQNPDAKGRIHAQNTRTLESVWKIATHVNTCIEYNPSFYVLPDLKEMFRL
jgi:hypothetical protein